MMLREFSRLTVSMLRPMGFWTAPETRLIRPFYRFLNNFDGGMGASGDTSSECRPHGQGSYIVFADGHVRHFTVDFYPDHPQITASKCLDPATQQWYNYYYASPSTAGEQAKNRTIAITP